MPFPFGGILMKYPETSNEHLSLEQIHQAQKRDQREALNVEPGTRSLQANTRSLH